MAGESARATAHAAAECGAEDEESTARALGALSADGWRVFHDARWPGRAQANIDHVLVGPSGIFVIDSLSWSGHIEVRGGALRLDGRRRARNVIASAAAAMAVGELLPGLDPKVIHPVICFDRTEPIFGWSGDTMICSTENVVTFLTSRPQVLAEEQMTDVAEALSISLDAAPAPMPSARSTYRGEGAASDAPTRRKARREQRLPRPPLPRQVRVLAWVGLLALAVGLSFWFDAPARLGDLGASVAHRVVAPTEHIGTTVSVPGFAGRPALDVTAGAPLHVRSRVRGVTPAQGHQLIAVPVSVQNTGDKPWRSDSDLTMVLTDSTDMTFSSDPAFTSVLGGRVLATDIELPPGEQTSGLVVFEVPRTSQVAKVRMRVGPGLPTTLRWTVD